MKDHVNQSLAKKITDIAIILLIILFGGSLGYYFIGNRAYSFFDCLYMTFITISTIGYGEVIDLSASPGGRAFTILVALCGIGTLTYAVSTATALIVEGNLTHSFRRRKMEKKIALAQNHFIVCSAENVGMHIINELAATQRLFVVIAQHRENMDALLEKVPQALVILGDPTDNETLLEAGISRASGLFATDSDDNRNLVVCLSATHLNPKLRIVAHVREPKNMEKMKNAGAHSVISSEQIGGLRMASEMARPAVVSFLDTMLRDTAKNLRVEEVSIPAAYCGKTIRELDLKRYRDLLLLAVREQNEWIYNPEETHPLATGSTLVFMGMPAARIQLETDLANTPL